MQIEGNEASVTYYGVLDMQICVPKDWTDEQVVEAANRLNPIETKTGWVIRKEGDRALSGDPERKPCTTYDDRVHIMLDA